GPALRIFPAGSAWGIPYAPEVGFLARWFQLLSRVHRLSRQRNCSPPRQAYRVSRRKAYAFKRVFSGAFCSGPAVARRRHSRTWARLGSGSPAHAGRAHHPPSTVEAIIVAVPRSTFRLPLLRQLPSKSVLVAGSRAEGGHARARHR